MATVSVKEAAAALSAASCGLGAKENDIQANCFLIKDGRVWTYNDEVAVSTLLPKGFEDISCVVQGKEFLSLMNKLSGDAEITQTEDALVLKTRRTKSTFKVETDIKMPVLDIKIPEKRNPLPENFLTALSCLLPIAGKDMTKPLSTCIDLKDNIARVADVSVAGQWEFDEGYKFEKEMLLPAAAARIVSKFAVSDISCSEGWIHFTTEGKTEISCRAYYEGQEGIDLSHLLNAEGVEVGPLPKDLETALERSDIFASAKTGTETTIGEIAVDVSIADNWCKIKCESSVGKYEEKVRIDYSGDPVAFMVAPELLRDAMKYQRVLYVCESFVKLKDERFTHVVAVFVPVEEDTPEEKVEKKAKRKKDRKINKDEVPF